MTEEIEELKEQNAELKLLLENRKMEEEPQEEKYQSPINEELLKLTRDQINEIQLLKLNFKEQNLKNQSLTQ